MTTAIQSIPPAEVNPGSIAHSYFTPAQEKMILDTFLGGATKEEAFVLLETVRRRKLDPFSRQVYFVKRWDSAKRCEVWAIQTSIDGLRSIADRTGNYEGQTPPEWCGPDGKWRDVWLEKAPPAAARVGVYKTKCRDPLYGVARFDAYVQTKKDGTVTSFWQKMPDLMLAKCAEALAIRKAFPEDAGGLYVAEEMGSDREDPSGPAPAPVALKEKIAAKLAQAPVVEVVQPPAPEKPAAKAKATKPPHVVAAWELAKKIHGDAKTAEPFWKAAVTSVIGSRPVESMDEQEALTLEAVLSDGKDLKKPAFEDVPF